MSRPRSRPGGRSARVRDAVHGATRELLSGPDWARTSLAAVADRAGVQPSTLYRRWGSLDALLTDVHEARLAERSPLPDTGSLAGDLHAWADAATVDLTGPDGAAHVRVLVLLDSSGGAGSGRADEALPARTDQIRSMLDRAAARGEAVPSMRDVFELLISPLYGYALFGPAGMPGRSTALVERLLDHVVPPAEPASTERRAPESPGR